MTREVFKNSSADTLNGAINSSVTSIVVNAGSAFPSTGNFRILIDSEIMLCTARSSSTLTVVRGQEGTSGASHLDLAPVTHILTGGNLRQFARDNDPYFDSDRPQFGMLDNSGNTLTSSDFTVVNLNSTTISDQNGTISIRHPAQSASDSITMLARSAPGTPYSVIAGMRMFSPSDSNVAIPLTGLFFRDSGTGKFQTLFIRYSTTNSTLIATVSQWNSETSADSTNVTTCMLVPSDTYWMKLTDDGTNLIYAISNDGINFVAIFSASRTAWLATPDQVGWLHENFNSTFESIATLVHWAGA